MTTLHGLGLMTALGLVATCAGCTGPSGSFSPGPHAAPTRTADCNDLPAAGADPGIGLGTDWSGEHHDYTDTVVVHGCVSASLGGRASLVTDGTGIQIRPGVVAVDPTGSGIVAFRVTVSPNGSGRTWIQQRSRGGGGDLPGPVVVADADGWHFVSHE